MGIAEICPSMSGIRSELAERFSGLNSEQLDAISIFLSARIGAANARFNALLLSKILMRLAEADNSQLVPASLAFAVKLTPIFLRRKACRVPKEAAEILGVTSKKFESEIEKSREFLYE